ncbi:MAG TPA: cupin domain-containing protein [Thermomicrobiales bacterium]|jgi:uncharacterized RmlC-like cupin family protein|nr:cupin domain-containing protein [Thermomicrobiales bacterium]
MGQESDTGTTRTAVRTGETGSRVPAAAAGAGVARVVHGGERYQGKQGLDYTPGVSAETLGARALWLGAVTIPPGGRTRAHIHEHHESAFYLVSGDAVELWSGERLQHQEVACTGDYLYIPAGVPHVAVNRSQVPAFLVGARTDANEQESVVMMPDLDARVP